MSDKDKRAGILKAITMPLGFYSLALLIVEGFLAVVLTYGNLEPDLQREGMRCGIGLFLLVLIVVSLFVWFKPTHLIYSEYGSLVHAGKVPYGTELEESHDKLPIGDSVKEEN